MNQNPTRALLTWDNYLPEVPLYDVWTENLGVPIHETYFVPDLRTIEVGHWDEMGCNAAFIKLKDFPPSTKMRVAEIPPAAVLPEYKLSVDDIMYVLSGQGPCTVWGVDGKQHTFEWGPRSVFLMPRNYRYQLANARGHEPARIFHFNYLPLGMMMIPNVKWFFNNSALEPDVDLFGGEGSETYSEARYVPGAKSRTGYASGGFRKKKSGPDEQPTRENPMAMHWQEGSMFTPPDLWFHQHMNVLDRPPRYLTFHPARQVQPLYNGGNVPFVEEHPIIRQTFEAELARRGLKSNMPPELYTDPNFAKGREREFYQAGSA